MGGARSLGPGGVKSGSYAGFSFKRAEIKKVVKENPKVKSFYLKVSLPEKPRPGQFVMVWLPGAEEVPMSVSGVSGDGIRISVSREGKTTSKFHKLRRGEALFVRGPFGNGFSPDGKSCLLVGGGCGVAPLIYAAKEISRSGGKGTYLTGAKNKAGLLFLEEARKCGMEVCTATEDGSAGEKGLATHLSKKLIEKKRFDLVLTCGPERMMAEVVRQGLKRGIKVQASLERYMKCGFGVCGSCVLDPLGLRVCIDGPVFDGELLLKTEFNKFKRDASGARVPI